MEKNTIITELAGGYGNIVSLENGIVRKKYRENEFTKSSAQVRMKREELSLRYFSPFGIAPKLLGVGANELLIEYLAGRNYLDLHKSGVDVLYSAGSLLSQIHIPVNRPISRLRDAFERKIEISLTRASALIRYLNLKVHFTVDWEDIYALGTTRIHGDYWLANIIGNGAYGKVIDWEFGSLGSPYQDFAAMELWTFQQYGKADDFWNGYEQRPKQHIINQYVKYECLDYLGDITIPTYEEEELGGFYHHKVDVIRNL